MDRVARSVVDRCIARQIVGLDRAVREPVTVRCNRNDLLAVDDEEQTIEVVTDVLLGHREVDHRDQVLQRLLRQREAVAT